MEFNSSYSLRVTGSDHVRRFEGANAIKSKATRSRRSIMRAMIDKSHGLVLFFTLLLLMSSMLKYSYLSSGTNLTLVICIHVTFTCASITNKIRFIFIERYFKDTSTLVYKLDRVT